jgi:hypothetical protein
MTADDPTSYAADLAERLVDEVARPDQRWATILSIAAELARFAADVVARESDESDH